MTRKNISTISVLEVFLCLFVIFIHIASEGISYGTPTKLLPGVLFICSKLMSFVVPAFIFSSAFKMALKYKGTKPNYGKFIWGRIKKIYIPYLIWVILYYLYFAYIGHHFDFHIWDLIRYILDGTLVAHFYFIIIIMQFYIVMPILLKWYKRTNPWLMLVAALIITYAFRMLTWIYPQYFSALPGSSISINYFIFWTMGSYAALYYDQLASSIRKHWIWITTLTLAVAAGHIALSYRGYIGVYEYTYAEPVHLAFCIIMTVGFYTAIHMLMPFFKRYLHLFNALTRVSFYVYLSHILVIFIIQYLLRRTAPTLFASFIAKAAFTYTIPFAISFLYLALKKRIYSTINLTENTGESMPLH